MRRMERVHGYLVRNNHRVAIRSKTVADELQEQQDAIEQLKNALMKSNLECGRLEAELKSLRGRWWVRFGARLRLVRG